MNYNQLLLKEALQKGLHDALFTHNKYREILDVCLAALEEPEQASEPTQTGLTGKIKNLVQVRKNAKQEAVNVPFEAILKPEPITFKRAEGAAFIREPDEKDEYDAAMAEWRESFNAWKEKDAEADERINEIADKVNKIYAVLNERVHPLVKRIDNDVHQVKKQTEASANKLNTTIHYTGGQMTEEQANEFVARMKNELAKSMREERLKGGKK